MGASLLPTASLRTFEFKLVWERFDRGEDLDWRLGALYGSVAKFLCPGEDWPSARELVMSEFKWRHFEGEIILWAVRWYCRYGISYRDLEQMMCERGVLVDHSTIYRWVQKHAPEIEKRLRWQWRRPQSTSWRVDGLCCINPGCKGRTRR